MNVYIPTREEIANRLQMIADVVRHAKTLSEVESELTDELGTLQFAVSNRAGVESGRITNDGRNVLGQPSVSVPCDLPA